MTIISFLGPDDDVVAWVVVVVVSAVDVGMLVVVVADDGVSVDVVVVGFWQYSMLGCGGPAMAEHVTDVTDLKQSHLCSTPPTHCQNSNCIPA